MMFTGIVFIRMSIESLISSATDTRILIFIFLSWIQGGTAPWLGAGLTAAWQSACELGLQHSCSKTLLGVSVYGLCIMTNLASLL